MFGNSIWRSLTAAWVASRPAAGGVHSRRRLVRQAHSGAAFEAPCASAGWRRRHQGPRLSQPARKRTIAAIVRRVHGRICGLVWGCGWRRDAAAFVCAMGWSWARAPATTEPAGRASNASQYLQHRFRSFRCSDVNRCDRMPASIAVQIRQVLLPVLQFRRNRRLLASPRIAALRLGCDDRPAQTKDPRKERLAQALRENLKRRKAQIRGRAEKRNAASEAVIRVRSPVKRPETGHIPPQTGSFCG